MKVRPARASDVEAIARIQAETMVWCGHFADSNDVDAEYERLLPRIDGYLAGTYDPGYALPSRAVLVAEQGGEVVGFVAGHASTRMAPVLMDGEAELQWMFVLPAWHRQGIGTRLLRPMAAWFLEHHCRHVIVDAAPGNPFRGFYLRNGAEALDHQWLHWPDVESGVG